MIHLAVNYSRQAAQLIRAGVVDVDRYKCPFLPPVYAEAQAQRPSYVHFGFRAGKRPFCDIDWAAVRQAVAATATAHVNMHLAPDAADFDGMSVETTRPADAALLIEAMERDVAELAGQFPPEEIVLENVMWDPLPPWQIPAPALQPEVVRRVVLDTGCRFLLDLSHAAICARYFKQDARTYIGALPLERLRELHLSGTALGDDGLWHDHQPMAEHDWGLAEWAIERIRTGDWPRPLLVTLEYGGAGPGFENLAEEPILARELLRLRDLVRAARNG